jgi:hypothetical protein
VELAQPAVTANETLDRQFAETIRQ